MILGLRVVICECKVTAFLSAHVNVTKHSPQCAVLGQTDSNIMSVTHQRNISVHPLLNLQKDQYV
jgi:hypothetical protein